MLCDELVDDVKYRRHIVPLRVERALWRCTKMLSVRTTEVGTPSAAACFSIKSGILLSRLDETAQIFKKYLIRIVNNDAITKLPENEKPWRM
jgi:hypothetical protein